MEWVRYYGYVTYPIDTSFLDPEKPRTLVESQVIYLQYAEATLCSIFFAEQVTIPPERITQTQSLNRILERLRDKERICAKTFRSPLAHSYSAHISFSHTIYNEVKTYLQFHDKVPVLSDIHRRDQRNVTYDTNAVAQMVRLLCSAFVRFRYPYSTTGEGSARCYMHSHAQALRKICTIRARQAFQEGDNIPSISGIFVPLTKDILNHPAVYTNDFSLRKSSELSRTPCMLLGPCRFIRRACESYNIEFDKAANDTVRARACRAIAQNEELLVRYAPEPPSVCSCTDHMHLRLRKNTEEPPLDNVNPSTTNDDLAQNPFTMIPLHNSTATHRHDAQQCTDIQGESADSDATTSTDRPELTHPILSESADSDATTSTDRPELTPPILSESQNSGISDLFSEKSITSPGSIQSPTGNRSIFYYDVH